MSEIQESRVKDIFKNLKSQEIDIYFQGQHVGNCITPYVVVKPGVVSQVPGISSLLHRYSLLCYIPKNQPSQVEIFCNKVRKAMLRLSPMIKFNTTVSAPYFDEGVQGWLVELEYINYSKYDSDVFQKTN